MQLMVASIAVHEWSLTPGHHYIQTTAAEASSLAVQPTLLGYPIVLHKIRSHVIGAQFYQGD